MNQTALLTIAIEGESLAGRRSLTTAHAVRECAENWKVTLFASHWCILNFHAFPLTALISGGNSMVVVNLHRKY